MGTRDRISGQMRTAQCGKNVRGLPHFLLTWRKTSQKIMIEVTQFTAPGWISLENTSLRAGFQRAHMNEEGEHQRTSEAPKEKSPWI